MLRARSKLVLGLSVAALVGTPLVGYLAGGSAPVTGRTPLSAAVATLPPSMVGVGFTDWNAALRGQSASDARRRDLLTRSVFRDLAESVRAPTGLQTQDIAWEAYARDLRREVEILRLKRGASLDAAGLQQAGYQRRDGLWIAWPRSGAAETTMAVMAWLPRQRLVVASSTLAVVEEVLDIVAGRAPSLANNPHARAAAEALAGPTSALLESAQVGCDATRVEGGEFDAQVRAAQQRFGELERFRFLGRGLTDQQGTPDVQKFVMAMSFGSAAQASRQARTRSELSSGPFIGRMGSMDEVLQLTATRTSGSTVVLVYDHPIDSAVLMTGRGPLLPAACGS